MTTPQQPALAYVLKRYPRFSETFIVNWIKGQKTALGIMDSNFIMASAVDRKSVV